MGSGSTSTRITAGDSWPLKRPTLSKVTYVAQITAVPLLLIDDLGMRRLPHTAAEDFLEIVMRRYEKASTLITSNRPAEDWGKLLGDTAAVAALARPSAPPCPCPHLRPQKLAHPAAGRRTHAS